MKRIYEIWQNIYKIGKKEGKRKKKIEQKDKIDSKLITGNRRQHTTDDRTESKIIQKKRKRQDKKAIQDQN